MTLQDWFAEPINWVFLLVGLVIVFAALRVVTSPNVVHAALWLVATMGGVAVTFLLLSAEFVSLVLVLVYLGAVIVLFLFGIMITRAPTGSERNLDHKRKMPAAILALTLFGVLSWTMVEAFGETAVESGFPSSTAELGQAILGRYVIPFEVVGVALLAALIGGVTLARRDLTVEEEEEGGGV